MSPLGKGLIWLSILAETFRAYPGRGVQYASSVYVHIERAGRSPVEVEFNNHIEPVRA